MKHDSEPWASSMHQSLTWLRLPFCLVLLKTRTARDQFFQMGPDADGMDSPHEAEDIGTGDEADPSAE